MDVFESALTNGDVFYSLTDGRLIKWVIRGVCFMDYDRDENNMLLNNTRDGEWDVEYKVVNYDNNGYVVREDIVHKNNFNKVFFLCKEDLLDFLENGFEHK